jgi:prepilin-type N-terminal cleavage/methylation domain-containing protein
MKTQNSKFKILNSKRGFTLVETLVAIAILTVAIAGPITIASKGLAAAMFARDQITAFYLAQEAVEFIRNKRDENNIKGFGASNWLKDLQTCFGATPCSIDVTAASDNAIKNCSGTDCLPLKYDSNMGLYGYSSGDDSIFTRNVKMETIEANEASIEVSLSWRTGLVQKSFVVTEHIFNWQ